MKRDTVLFGLFVVLGILLIYEISLIREAVERTKRLGSNEKITQFIFNQNDELQQKNIKLTEKYNQLKLQYESTNLAYESLQTKNRVLEETLEAKKRF